MDQKAIHCDAPLLKFLNYNLIVQKMARLAFVLMWCILQITMMTGQQRYTPYDDLPGINKSFKPALSDDAPQWAKLMYQYPVNYNELKKQFEISQSKGREKNPYTRYFLHWSHFVASLVGPQGEIIMPAKNEIQRKMTSSRERTITSSARDQNSWTFLGPKVTHWLRDDNNIPIPNPCPWQVNIYSMDIARSNPNLLYCGTETGVINKSSDKGLHWQMVSKDYYLGGAVNALVIHKSNSDIVYASAGNQVHKTINGGSNWRPLLSDFIFNANTLQISNNGLQLLASSDQGVFISNNEGSIWERKVFTNCWDVEYKPQDENMIYALATENQFFRLYISDNGGQTFKNESTFPQNIKDIAGGVIATTPSNPGLIMLTLLSENKTPFIFKGIKNGSSWIWTEVTQGKTSKLKMDNGQGYYDLDMEISPVDENKFVVGTTTMYKTDNGGASFTAVGGYDGNFSIHPDIQDVKFEPNGSIWVATDGGLTVSTDFFTSQSNFYTRNNGIIGSGFWGFDQGWNEDIVVGGRYHNGNTAIADFYQPKALRMGGAESPTGWVLQGRSRHVAFNDLGNGWILPAKAEEKSEGRFLFTKFPNMDEYGGRRGALLHHPYYHSHLFLSEGNSVWISKNGGAIWDVRYQFPGRVMTMVIGVNHPEVMYADVVGHGLYRSGDGGLSWVKKPSLTTSPNGSAMWNGKLSLALSPYNPDVIYACLQNGTWSADKGKVFKSTDGGTTWKDITFGIDAYLKTLVVQPSEGKKDLVYLFTNSTKNLISDVWILKDGAVQWETYSKDYPVNMNVLHVLPFYRDGKIRVAGDHGIWEAALMDTNYEPIIRPWVQSDVVTCISDTITFDDHSIISHNNTSWEWTIEPKPQYISSTSVRNPKVVMGKEGKYSVTMKVTQQGKVYEKTISDMIQVKTCPSLETCDNPVKIPKSQWKVIGFDSEEKNNPGLASMAIDDKPNTIWHTRWSTGSDPYPHHIHLDLGRKYKIFEFIYLPRQDGGENGRVKDYEIYFSDNPNLWGDPTVSGSFENNAAPKIVKLPGGKDARYIRFRALSEVKGNAWTSAAEFDLTGCYAELTNLQYEDITNVSARPIPAQNSVILSLPAGHYDYMLYNIEGRLEEKGQMDAEDSSCELDISKIQPGYYHVIAINKNGTQFRMKIVKM
jgi:photosystem II stability/assembly factor-like uncharacterized protein